MLINQKPGIGRKKASQAKCNFYKIDSINESTEYLINNRIPNESLMNFIHYHLKDYNQYLKNHLVKVWVKGGGISGQKYAVLKSIVRNLLGIHPELKNKFKNNPHL